MRIVSILGQSILLVSLAATTAMVTPASVHAQVLAAGTPVRTLARRSVLAVWLDKDLTLKEARPGDLVTATVALNIVDKDAVLIPEGTIC